MVLTGTRRLYTALVLQKAPTDAIGGGFRLSGVHLASAFLISADPRPGPGLTLPTSASLPHHSTIASGWLLDGVRRPSLSPNREERQRRYERGWGHPADT